ncbi:MAG: hypothetical protein CMH65_09830 [Nevskiales bacterium]|nr:hypothetical protein [Nevskiales bacterium]
MNILIGLIAMPFILAWRLIWNTVLFVIVALAYTAPLVMPVSGASYLHETGGNWLIGGALGLAAVYIFRPVANVLTGLITWLLGEGYLPLLKEAFEEIQAVEGKVRSRRTGNPSSSSKAPYIHGLEGGGANPIFQENSE